MGEVSSAKHARSFSTYEDGVVAPLEDSEGVREDELAVWSDMMRSGLSTRYTMTGVLVGLRRVS